MRFPEDAGEDVEGRNATSIIRLLTRLIFVWFIKEKGLVPDTLFNPGDLGGILNSLNPQESTYYKAILQNLFFATLNQEINTPQNPNNRRTSLYHYKDYFIDPDDALRKFEEIPFLNGGLFECLDVPSKEDSTRILPGWMAFPMRTTIRCVFLMNFSFPMNGPLISGLPTAPRGRNIRFVV